MKNKLSFSLIALAVITILSFALSSEANAQSSCCTKTSTSCETNGTSSGTESSACAICKVAGESTPISYTYLGTEYKFCAEGCVEEFKAEPMNYIEANLQCPVEGGTAKKDVYTVVDGVKYYFCCQGCDKEFSDNSQKYVGGFKGDSKH